MAGGNTYEVFNAGAYNATRWAKQGDLGTQVRSLFTHRVHEPYYISSFFAPIYIIYN